MYFNNPNIEEKVTVKNVTVKPIVVYVGDSKQSEKRSCEGKKTSK